MNQRENSWVRLSRLWQVARQTWFHFNDDDGLQIAGNMAFMGVLSLFPFLIFVTALAGILGDPQIVEEMKILLYDSMPSDIAATLAPVVEEVLGQQRSGLLTFGIIGALWTASSGVESLRLGLNRAYDGVETRSVLFRRLQSAGFVIGGALIFTAAAALIVLGPLALHHVRAYVPIPLKLAVAFNIFRYLAGSVALAAGLWTVHRYLPYHPVAPRHLWPGILATIVMWLLAASAFSLYLAHLGNYAVTYGSLGGVIAALLFFYLSAAIFVLGGEVNMALNRMRAAAGGTGER